MQFLQLRGQKPNTSIHLNYYDTFYKTIELEIYDQ